MPRINAVVHKAALGHIAKQLRKGFKERGVWPTAAGDAGVTVALITGDESQVVSWGEFAPAGLSAEKACRLLEPEIRRMISEGMPKGR